MPKRIIDINWTDKLNFILKNEEIEVNANVLKIGMIIFIIIHLE